MTAVDSRGQWVGWWENHFLEMIRADRRPHPPVPHPLTWDGATWLMWKIDHVTGRMGG